MVEHWVLDYAAAAAAGAAVAGGKGWNLGRLDRYGFTVPHGCVIAAGAYRAFLQHNDLQDLLNWLAAIPAERADATDVGDRLAELRSRMQSAPMPDGLEAALAGQLKALGLEKASVAVRSSATAEDSAAASFAGIHRSFLNIQGLPAILEQVRGCYASLWTPQALAYRRRMGLGDQDVAAAVVICELVPARASGVCFNADPVSGRRDRVVIAGNFGLGESVVMGSSEVDEYTVAVTNVGPARLIDGRIGYKHHAVRPQPGGGVYTEELGYAERSQPVLERAWVERLALLAQRVQDALGEGHLPQDIEWAYTGYDFVLLQARPVTALPWATFPALAGQALIWSNANMKDAYPGVQSPFSWWLNSATHEVMLRQLCTWTAYNVPEGLTWSRLWQGRLYLNLSAIQWAAWDAFGAAPPDTNRFMGGHQPIIALTAGASAGEAGSGQAERLGRLNKEMARAEERADDTFTRVQDWVRQQVADDLDQLADQHLIRRLWQMEQERRQFLPETMIHNVNALWSGRLMHFLERYFPGRGQSLGTALLSGSGGVTSAEHGYKLLQIAHIAHQEPAALAWLTGAAFDPGEFRVGLLGTRTLKAIETYLQQYGYRGVYEMELMNPRWAEDPSYLLQTLRSHLQAGLATASPWQDAVQRRQAAEAEVAARLRWHPVALLSFRRLLKKARQGMRLREDAKAALVRLLWPLRRWALAAGRRLVRRRLLEHAADVFFLTGNELAALLSRQWDGKGLPALLADRRKHRVELEQMDPPDVILGEEAQTRQAAAAPAAAPTDGRTPALTGVGVAAGVASGPARPIRHPGEGTRLQKGDVLVAPSTDPAWTPLFLRASAVVMEVGGYLSHGAIVAREYGIPAVANAAGAMGTVSEGERIQVDGDRGLIFRE